MTDLGGVGYGVSLGFGINAAGEAVGRSYLAQTVPTTGCPPRHTCVTHPADPFSWIVGSMTDLGTLGGTFSEARAVNRNGDIGGGSNSDAFPVHSGKLSNLGPGDLPDLRGVLAAAGRRGAAGHPDQRNAEAGGLGHADVRGVAEHHGDRGRRAGGTREDQGAAGPERHRQRQPGPGALPAAKLSARQAATAGPPAGPRARPTLARARPGAAPRTDRVTPARATM